VCCCLSCWKCNSTHTHVRACVVVSVGRGAATSRGRSHLCSAVYAHSCCMPYCCVVVLTVFIIVPLQFARVSVMNNMHVLMALIFPRVFIVFTISSFEFHQVKLPWLYRQWWVIPIHPASIHWINRLGVMLESYRNLQPEPKSVPEWNRHSSWFGLLYRRKPLTTLWKTTASDCRQRVSASGGHFENIMW